jgi:hypothetical protein
VRWFLPIRSITVDDVVGALEQVFGFDDLAVVVQAGDHRTVGCEVFKN